jgi:hypothetical protein
MPVAGLCLDAILGRPQRLTFVGEVRGQNASSIGSQIVHAEFIVSIGHDL